MAGAVAVAMHRQRAMEQREARKQFMEDQLRMNRYFTKYDKTNEGTLNKDELRALLKDLNDGKEVSEDEFAWVMETADRSQTGDLSFGELKIAVCTFKTYQRSKPFIDSVMLKYDEHKTGRLEFGDLKKMLKDISGGVEPSDVAVADVLERFGTKAKAKLTLASGGAETAKDVQEDGIPTVQTVHAISYWYTHPKAVNDDEEGLERAASNKDQVAAAGKPGSVCGGCCVS
uniref:EF-hand domain-containing protein n=1 Tax=Hemiselmis tepida TaxID=464990 RepID=A0A7S0VNV0_9CRYP|mmetsp:Transcript_218/g.595  ORF Transcript_218/g.595 Transcript_218/m.595 type:complete len:230 (+) Transcript_218:166-855(+)